MNENKYDDLFKKYAKANNIDWLLLKAQVKAESNFNPNAKSPVGALGLAQFMRATWEEWKDGTAGIQATKMLYDRTNPEHSIRAQSAYMAWLLKQAGGNIDVALAMYNWGIGNVKKIIKKTGSFENAFPFLPKETRDYVSRISRFYKEYKKDVR